ncbi:nucleoid-structuring protein H-NS [Bacillus anthracis]|nr:nucleoid-structuring protein H-NS [Bacillus anthracis]AJZ69172.1 nucleoid-structuring protein H-NS [Bacillus anthracis str. A16R]AJZ69390.1 nucleoid-structuring protein H-NS [Bacillus anthracis str. A16]EJT19215.1 HK97 family phage portal protein [Bacillus anthracis str. UR-1]KEY92566.1 nucleoid-structuring protein H-NS [Bacillus anthracis str. Carbosap]
MGLFNKIFGKKQPPTTTRFEMINDNGGGFFHGMEISIRVILSERVYVQKQRLLAN